MAVQPYSATAPIKALAGTEASPGITFTGGDTNTGIYSPAANQLGITTGGTGKLIIDENGSLQVVGGTKDNPAIYFDEGTGIYSPGADQVAISTNGQGRLFVDADGNIGLGTNSPANYANFVTLALADTSGAEIDFIKGSTVQSAVYNAGDVFYIESKSTVPTAFVTNGDERLRITSAGTLMHLGAGDSTTPAVQFNGSAPANSMVMLSDGKVGLGTSSPGGYLTAYRSGAADQYIHFENGTTTAGVDYDVAKTLKLNLVHGGKNAGFDAGWSWTSGCGAGVITNNGYLSLTKLTSRDGFAESDVLRVNTSGDVGIGTTNPGARLEIDAAAATSPFIAKINTSEAARIDSSGRLLIGTTSETGNAMQTIRGSVNNPTGAGVLDLGLGTTRPTAADTYLGVIRFTSTSNTDASYHYASIAALSDGSSTSDDDIPGGLVFSSNPGAPATIPLEAMRINSAQELLIGYTSDNGAYKLQVNSQIFATSATIATSDGRYKENVASLNGCLDLVKALRPVSFTWKPQEDITCLDDEGNEVLVREGHNFPEGTQVGFIAQEVQEVFDGKPWLGSVIKENVRPAVKDNDGNELAPEEQFYGIAEGNLITVLTNALQEAVTEIESLKARLDAANL